MERGVEKCADVLREMYSVYFKSESSADFGEWGLQNPENFVGIIYGWARSRKDCIYHMPCVPFIEIVVNYKCSTNIHIFTSPLNLMQGWPEV